MRFSIRPGWFYHKEEDSKVKSVNQLMDIYYNSVGRNCNLLLNIGVDRRGLVNENDIARLMEFKNFRENTFKNNLAKGTITASNFRGKDKIFSAEKVLDSKFETYWTTDDGVTNASLTLDFGRETEFNRLLLQENIALGQRVKKFSIQIWNGKEFETISQATTIGYKRILRFPIVKTAKVKIIIEDAKASPTISTLEIYRAKN